MIADHLTSLLTAGVDKLRAEGVVPYGVQVAVDLQRPARPQHGEFATNLPLALAKPAGLAPRQLAEELVARMPDSELLERVEIAGPGFINFHLSHRWLEQVLRDISEERERYGRGAPKEEKVQIEFVSANPTGPLHVGSGRNAAYGDALARLMSASGHDVYREYYVNDAGKQMERFGASLHARYLQALGRDGEVPEDGYHGEYLAGLGKELAATYGDELAGDPDKIRQIGTQAMVKMHEATLARFRVTFDNWVSETSLHEAGKVRVGIDRLAEGGHTFEADGAIWFRSSALGASRDQVIVRSDERATPTYLGADIAYMLDKIERGFDRLIYVWGADHHGNVAGLKAVAKALGIQQSVEVILHQMVNFITASGEAAKMSKRAGTIVTLDQLIDEVGTDAARFTLLGRTVDVTIDFDMELVRSESQENPVYYVQYQHARTCSILRNAAEKGVRLPQAGKARLDRMTSQPETALIRKLAELPDLIEESARLRAPHRLTHFAQALASMFSIFYRDCRVLSDDTQLTEARLVLVDGARQVLANTLSLLGVSAPESM